MTKRQSLWQLQLLSAAARPSRTSGPRAAGTRNVPSVPGLQWYFPVAIWRDTSARQTIPTTKRPVDTTSASCPDRRRLVTQQSGPLTQMTKLNKMPPNTGRNQEQLGPAQGPISCGRRNVQRLSLATGDPAQKQSALLG